MPVAYHPAAQLLQEGLPDTAYVPAAQDLQLNAPEDEACLPAAQLMHLVESVASVPDGQLEMHSVASIDEYFPEGQVVQPGLLLSTGLRDIGRRRRLWRC